MLNGKIPVINSCTIGDIVDRISQLPNNNQYDTSKIIKAYKVAEEAHKNQFRKSGEPYIIHPLCVSMILLELGMDDDTICAGLLHDVVEDTDLTLNDIRRDFGQVIANLVDGVTKIGKIPSTTKEEQVAENILKIVIAGVEDVRVIIIKLADRLHNMRTLQHRDPDGQRRTACETMNLFVPIAHRLGIYTIQNELEELSFKYLDPFAYEQIDDLMELNREDREKFIETIKARIRAEFDKYPECDFLTNATIDGRVKSMYGMYKKMFLKSLSFSQIYDKYALRIIVEDKNQCYVVLGIIHDIFTPIPGRMKDYIACPKPNLYQSLHTTVVGAEGIPFEVQIRSWSMHKHAEYGIAAHWKYKEGTQEHDRRFEECLNWLRNVVEVFQTSNNPECVVDMLKSERSNGTIIVVTPKGDNKSLPYNGTVIDFAYKIHTNLGNTAIGAKVNGCLVPLSHVLNNGDIVEILRSKDPNKGPNRAWLDIAVTSEAKSKIRAWFKREERDENIVRGKDTLEREFKHFRMHVPPEDMNDFLSDNFKRYSCQTLDDFYASIGYGGIILPKIMPRLRSKYEKKYLPDTVQETQPIKPKKEKKVMDNRSHGIVFDNGLDGCEIKISQCCSPMPYDEIVGFITRGKGVSIHKKTCPNYRSAVKKNYELERWISARWSESKSDYFQANFEVVATDRIGLVFDITSIMTQSRIMIKHSSSGMLKNGNAVFRASIFIASPEQLNNLFDKLKKVEGVISVSRV
jgi:GTP pyrophosphokinase